VSPFWLVVWCSVIVELGILGVVLWVAAVRSLL